MWEVSQSGDDSIFHVVDWWVFSFGQHIANVLLTYCQRIASPLISLRTDIVHSIRRE